MKKRKHEQTTNYECSFSTCIINKMMIAVQRKRKEGEI